MHFFWGEGMAYVLMVVIWAHGVPQALMQEFTSETRCLQARDEFNRILIKGGAEGGAENGRHLEAVYPKCVPK
jgi:hypothetical protein